MRNIERVNIGAPVVNAKNVEINTDVRVYPMGSSDKYHHIERKPYKARVVRIEETSQPNNPAVIVRSVKRFSFPHFLGSIGGGTAVEILNQTQSTKRRK